MIATINRQSIVVVQGENKYIGVVLPRGARGVDGNSGTIEIENVNGLETALNNKEPVISTGNTSQYLRGDKTWQTLDKSAIGLNNVVNADTTTTQNISDYTNKRFITDSKLTEISDLIYGVEGRLFKDVSISARGNNATTFDSVNTAFVNHNATRTITGAIPSATPNGIINKAIVTLSNTNARNNFVDISNPILVDHRSCIVSCIISPYNLKTFGQFYVGLCETVGDNVSAPESKFNNIAIGRKTTSNNLSVFIAGASVVTEYDLGDSFPVNQDIFYKLVIYYKVGLTRTIKVKITNLTDNSEFENTYQVADANSFPTSSVLLYPHLCSSNKGTITDSSVHAFSEFRIFRFV